jgi:DNA-binding NarL/FixJ family response regulator
MKILIADDHKIVRDGLRQLLERETGFHVVGEASEGRTAVRLVKELKPDIVIMDIGMADMNGIEATRQIKASNASTQVIALSMHSEKRFVSEMLKAGASAYVLKEDAFDELLTTVHEVANHRKYLSRKIMDVVVDQFSTGNNPKEQTAFSLLSPREREVLQLIAEGKSTKEIASQLDVSTKTVDTYRQQITTKLNIHSIADLTKYAIREGLISLE